MCSTPKPKRKIKGKAGNASVGILSSMSSEKRLSFAQRANQASDRRIEAVELKKAERKRIDNIQFKKVKKFHKKTTTNTNQSWSFFAMIAKFLNAPLSDIFRKIIAGK